MVKTFGTLLAFLLPAVLPKVPWWAKLLIQIGLGLLVYNVFVESEFPFPMADTLPISSLFGGNVAKAWGDPEAKFAFLSMGFLGTVLGVLLTLVTTALGALFGKKKES